jgi:hypothetical protein
LCANTLTRPSIDGAAAAPGNATRATGTNDIYDVNRAEHIKLWLPSDIPDEHRLLVCANGSLITHEARFREAGCHDALVGIRKYRRTYSVLRSQYRGEFGGNGSSNVTKARAVLQSFSAKIGRCKATYRSERRALLALVPHGSWQETYRELLDKHVCGPYALDDDADLRATLRTRERLLGGGTKETSWIWTVNLYLDDTDEQDRVQWSRLCAYADRWEEELILLPEEMRRVLAFCDWEAGWWEAQVDRRQDSAVLRRALNAYARRQASLRRQRRDLFAKMWLPILTSAGLGIDWSPQYEHLLAAPCNIAPSVTSTLPTSSGMTTVTGPSVTCVSSLM